MQGIEQNLARDVECYSCGEEPSPLLMLRAPRLENWTARIGRRGKAFVLLIYGDVYRHTEYDDGSAIHTSAVVWFDRHQRWVRTSNRLYVLGTPGEETA
jgi:hypothetical protein